MDNPTRLIRVPSLSTMFAFAICLLLVWPSDSHAQNCDGATGNNAVYNPTCSANQPGFIGSSAFIDAKVFLGNGEGIDICDTINGILGNRFGSTYPAAGAVIDARGITTNLTCTQGSPWQEGNNYANVPSTVLLPAGTITIPSTWVLPNGTRVIGEGSFNGNTEQTIIQASASAFPANSPMIQFGNNNCALPSGCIRVTLEDVTLNGSGSSGLVVNGISNANAQELSYAKNVSMYQVAGIGLQISSNATNSGPYTNITYDTGGYASSNSTCASILNVTGGTRGIHGLTCISNGNTTAIALDSSGNSLEDISITGFGTGALVGGTQAAKSNVLKNVSANGTPTVVEIASGTSVQDLVLLGISNQSNTTTISDLATGTTLSDPAVVIYALGEYHASTNGYSRFTTSKNAAAWVMGTATPSSSDLCVKGSLFSCTGSGRTGSGAPIQPPERSSTHGVSPPT